MSCHRATEIDVEAFLVDSGHASFEEFRAHYPECTDCAAEVERWSAFEIALRQAVSDSLGLPGIHPEPERLEALLSSSGPADAEARQVEAHVAGCDSCRTELALLRRFDPAALAGAVEGLSSAERPPVAAPVVGWIERLREAFEGLREAASWPGGLVPAAAAAAVVLALVWAIGPSGIEPSDEGSAARLAARPDVPSPEPPERRLEVDPIEPESIGSSGDPSRLASTEEPSPAPIPAVPAPVEPSPSAPVEPIELAEAAPDPPSDPSPEASLAVAPAPVPAARAAAVPEATEVPAPPAAEEPPRDEILLAALTELPLPSYAAPTGAGSVGWMRQFGSMRSGSTAPTVEALAPQDHAGLSLSRSPRLWWRLAAPTEHAIQVTVVDEAAIDPLLRVEISGPHAAGLGSLDLAEQGVVLEPDAEIRWFVAVLIEPDRPSRNPISAGSIRVVSASDPRRELVAAASPSMRGHRLAELGLWYDALDFFAALSREHPESAPVVRHRDRLIQLARVPGSGASD